MDSVGLDDFMAETDGDGSEGPLPAPGHRSASPETGTASAAASAPDGTARVVAFDLETTGLDPENDRIVEFSFIQLDDGLNEISRWTERVNPTIPIPAEVVAVHGITDADVADKAPFKDFAARIQELVSDATLMAYNHAFDTTTLHYELERAGQPGLPMDHPVIDPLWIFREHFPHSLAGAVKHYLGRGIEDAHSAEADTQAMLDVFRAQINAHGLPKTASGNVLRRDRRYLDRKRCFYEDSDGVVRYGFGKHRHEPVADHVDYMQWMLGRDFPEDTKNVAKRLVDEHLTRAPRPPSQRPL